MPDITPEQERGFRAGIGAAVSTEQARRFLECAVRNWGQVSFDREGLEDFRVELERFRQKVLADALKRPEPSEALPADVCRLVIAARKVAFEDQGPEALRELDKASKAFAGLVPWEGEPGEHLRRHGMAVD